MKNEFTDVLDAKKIDLKMGENKYIKQSHSRISGCGSHSGIFNARSYQIGKTLLNKRQLRGRSRVTAFGDDGLCFYNGTSVGFTLIELLVVVLIIGILAAVAVPQYQKSVQKTRVKSILPLIKSIVQAQRVYYLANNQYTYDFSKLDIELPGENSPIFCDSGYNDGNYKSVHCNNQALPDLKLVRYYDQEYTICQASSNAAKEICKALCGTRTTTEGYCNFVE